MTKKEDSLTPEQKRGFCSFVGIAGFVVSCVGLAINNLPVVLVGTVVSLVALEFRSRQPVRKR